jgi:hypothetical protein
MYRAMSEGKRVNRIGQAEERGLRPDGRHELPLGRRRNRRCGCRRGCGGRTGRRARRAHRRGDRRAIPGRGRAPGHARVLGARPRDLRRVRGHAPRQPADRVPGGDRELLAEPVPSARVGQAAGVGARPRAILGSRHYLAAPAAEVDPRRPPPPQPARLGLARLTPRPAGSPAGLPDRCFPCPLPPRRRPSTPPVTPRGLDHRGPKTPPSGVFWPAITSTALIAGRGSWADPGRAVPAPPRLLIVASTRDFGVSLMPTCPVSSRLVWVAGDHGCRRF